MATLVVLLVLVSFTSLSQASMHVPALYVFGDSIVDGGNTFPRKPPYGIDLSSTLDVRSTNGKTIADFIASFLGLPVIPPSTNNSGVEISKTGLNYGHAGCGFLQKTGSGNCSFEDQIDQFNLNVSNGLTKVFNHQELVHHLTSSIFLISFGINDYTSNYYPYSGPVTNIEPENFAKILLNELSAGLKKLYKLGARKFVVKNIWPLGCTPPYINQSNPLAVSCNETANQLVLPFTNSLPTMLNNLQSYLTGAVFSHSDDFQFVADLIQNPGKYGITNTTGECYSFKNPNLTMCKDRDEYLYFDFVHPTQAANYFFSLNCFDGTLCSPINIRNLLGA